MNVYEKIAKARVIFAGKNIKKSGKNDFAGYAYYELCDIIPAIISICDELGILCEVSFTDALATMTVRNIEKPDDVALFTSPMSKASLKGCHEVQNLGAVQTYIKRYLYQNAFEIVESDALDKTHNPNKPPEKPAPPQKPPRTPKPALTPEQLAAQARAKIAGDKLGLTNDEKKSISEKHGGDLLIIAEYLEGVVADKEITEACAPDEQAIIDQDARNVQKTFGGDK